MKIYLECEGFTEQTNLDVLSRMFNKSVECLEGLIFIARKTTGQFKLKSKYTGDCIVKVKKERKKNKKTVKLIIENRKPYKKELTEKVVMSFKVDGKEYRMEQYAKMLNVSKPNLRNKLKGLSFATVNGVDTDIVYTDFKHATLIPFLYNGDKLYRNVSYKDVAEITGYSSRYITLMIKEDILKEKTGYEIFSRNPKEG